MESKTVGKYEFINESKNWQHGFKHETTVLYDGHEIIKHSVKYYNRTWEMYRYKTVMRGAIYKLMYNLENEYIRTYKKENGAERFKKGERQKVLNECKNTKEYKDLENVLNKL